MCGWEVSGALLSVRLAGSTAVAAAVRPSSIHPWPACPLRLVQHPACRPNLLSNPCASCFVPFLLSRRRLHRAAGRDDRRGGNRGRRRGGHKGRGPFHSGKCSSVCFGSQRGLLFQQKQACHARAHLLGSLREWAGWGCCGDLRCTVHRRSDIVPPLMCLVSNLVLSAPPLQQAGRRQPSQADQALAAWRRSGQPAHLSLGASHQVA